MKARAILSPSKWFEVARERWLLATLKTLPVKAPTWPIDSNLLERCEVNWPAEYPRKWLEPLLLGIRRLVRVRKSGLTKDKSTSPVTMAALIFEGREYPFAIDYSDYQEVWPDVAGQVVRYFKMQYDARGYDFPPVVPGGFVGADLSLYRFATRLRGPRRRREPVVYGRFGMHFGTEIRSKALRILGKQDKIRFEGTPEIIRYSRFLEEAARSALCLDLPGNGYLCFRLVDYLAIGGAIVSPAPRNTLPVPLEDGRHVLYCQEDLSDLVSICEGALGQPHLLAELRANAAEYFDRYMHRDQLAGYYLSSILEEV